MTNAEKFVEVFGTDLKRQYSTKTWWEQEFEQPESCGDCISRQAVLDLAKFDGRDGLGSIIHAFDVEQLPPVNPAEKQEPCTDAISRQAAIDAIQTLIDNILHHFEVTLGVEKRRYNECLQIIRELPSVKPEPYKEDNNGKNNSN